MTRAAERRPAETDRVAGGADTAKAGRGGGFGWPPPHVGARTSGRTGQDGDCAAEHANARAGRALSGDTEGRATPMKDEDPDNNIDASTVRIRKVLDDVVSRETTDQSNLPVPEL